MQDKRYNGLKGRREGKQPHDIIIRLIEIPKYPVKAKLPT